MFVACQGRIPGSCMVIIKTGLERQETLRQGEGGQITFLKGKRVKRSSMGGCVEMVPC